MNERPGKTGVDGTRSTRTAVTIDDLALSLTDGSLAGEGPKALFYAWFQLFRTAQIHAITNSALDRPIRNFRNLVSDLIAKDGRISLQAKDGSLFCNSLKLSLSSQEYFELALSTFKFFEERGIGGFVIDAALAKEQVYQLLEALVYAPAHELAYERINAKLTEQSVPMRANKTLGVSGPIEPDALLERRSYTFFTYSKLVVLYRTLVALDSTKLNKRNYLIRKIARSMQALVDICLEDDHTFLGITTVKSIENYAAHHAANVAVLSLVLGGSIGLAKADLADLGLAAMFADIGVADIPSELISQPGFLDEEEKAAVQQHCLRSTDYLLGEQVLSKSVLRRIVVAFEHHRGFDGGGYPSFSQPPELFSRIVAIADTYDALTSQRPWRKAYLPDEALGIILEQGGKRFDPVLVKVFVNCLGLYPIGSLLRLSRGELAVVVYSGGEGQRLWRPIVSIIGADGRPERMVDLCERDRTGRYARDIVSSEDPTKYGLQPSGLLALSPGS